MTANELIKALRRLKVQTGSRACLGCGYEHNCGIHGCAILREAIERVASFQKTFNENALMKLAVEYLGVEPVRLRELAAAEKEKEANGN